jgi:hypothetical protein
MKGKRENIPYIRMEILERGKAARHSTSILLNNTKNKAIPCHQDKLVMIAKNATLQLATFLEKKTIVLTT